MTRNPTRAQTLRLVIVLTSISIAPVKINPIPLCTGSPFRIYWLKTMANAKYARYMNTVSTDESVEEDLRVVYCRK